MSLVDRDKLEKKGVQINHTWLDSFILGQSGLNNCLGSQLEALEVMSLIFDPP